MSGKEIMEASRAPNVFDMPGSPYLRFDRKYSGVWQALMECVLRANELWYAVDPGGDTFKKGGVENRKDRQVATTLYSVMPMDVLQHLIAKVLATEACDTMKLLFERPSHVKQANL